MRENMELKYILRHFLNDGGQLTSFPAKRKMKLYTLFYLFDKFGFGKDYTEGEINDILLSWHTFGDPATLRRELYEYRFLERSRDGKIYRLSEKQPTMEKLSL